MTTLIPLGLLGVVVLAIGFAVSLAVSRAVIRYHLEGDGVRVTFLSFTMWFAPWKDIRAVRLVSGWQILRPSMTWRMGNKLLGPGVEIKRRFGGVVITPNDPEQFAREVKRRANLR